jgi:GNAT superfamily N-acetyltransferase
MRFVASHQDVATTKTRLSKGDAFVAVDGDTIVGTIILKDAAATNGSPFLDRPDVAEFSQFAVRPSHQRHGLGSRLIEMVEQRARQRGVAHLALDTSEHATGLIEMYTRKGFAFVEYAQWEMVNTVASS